MHLLTARLAATAMLALMPACGGCRKSPWTLWDAYSARFIDGQGRVTDPMDDRTTSEGQAYALFFALVDNDRSHFARVLAWTTDNLAQGNLGRHLPAWLWGKDKRGAWRALDANSAADADVWMAYTLLEAGRLWREPGYTAIAHGLMEQIALREVVQLPGFGPMLLPGPAGFVHKGSWTLNPSYLPEFLIARLAQADPPGPWEKIASGIPPLIRQSSPNGFAMDWIRYTPGSGFFPSSQFPGASASPPQGSYDAIRVYLWAGLMDPRDSARAELLAALPGMNAYLADHDAPPEIVSDRGIPAGKDGNAGFSAAVLPYLKAIPGSGKALARQSIRVNAEKDQATGMYGKDLAYYTQNLALFALGFLDGRFSFGQHGELKVEWSQS